MALYSTLNRKVFTASAGQTAFAFGDVLYFDQTHLKVYVAGVLKALSTHYTVSPTTNTPNGTPGGTVTFLTPMVGGEQVIILRDVPLIQSIDYQENEKFPANTHEKGLDWLTMICQQHEEKIARQIALPVTESPSTDATTLPSVASRASKYFGWDSDGKITALAAPTGTSITTAFTQTLLDDGTANDFAKTLYAGISDAGVVVGDEKIAVRAIGDGSVRLATIQYLLNAIVGLTAYTAPVVSDLLPIYSPSFGAPTMKITLSNLLKIVNALTEDIAPDAAADFLLSYDASAGAAKKVKFCQSGSWTPSVGGNATYTDQTGTYVKIGKLVMATCALTINVLGTGSASTISGLPFTVSRAGVGAVSWNNAPASYDTLIAMAAVNTTNVVFTGTTAASANCTSQSPLANSSVTYFTVCYETA